MKIDLDVLHTGTVRQLIDLALQAVDEGDRDVFWLILGAVTMQVGAEHPKAAEDLWSAAHVSPADYAKAVHIVEELQALYPETQP